MRSYLINRKQRVKCNGVLSDWLTLKCVVPQGSLLGPLLFNVFINDLNWYVDNTSLRLYADDTSQYASDTCPAILEYSLNCELQVLSYWFKEIFLQINNAKTKAMILGKSGYSYDLQIDNQILEIEDSLRTLGVTLDRELNFLSCILMKF